MDKLAYRIDEAVEITGLGRTTLYREIANGRLEVVKVGARTLITRAALEAYIAGLTSRSRGNAVA
jgi:excisionase family DNA binding protein